MSYQTHVALILSAVPGAVPTPDQLGEGALAFNTADRRIFARFGADVVDIVDHYSRADVDQLAQDLSTRLDDLAIGDIAGLFAALASKVNKEAGKGLSSNDYTDSARDTLAAVDQLAQDLISRLDDLAIGDVAGLFAALASKVNKVEGKGLSSNDYTDSDQAKLTAVGTMANRDVYISAQPPDDAVGNDGDVWLQHWS